MTKSWILSWAVPPVRGRGSARLDLGNPALHPKSCWARFSVNIVHTNSLNWYWIFLGKYFTYCSSKSTDYGMFFYCNNLTCLFRCFYKKI